MLSIFYALSLTACHAGRLEISFHQRATLGYFCSASNLSVVSSMSAPRNEHYGRRAAIAKLLTTVGKVEEVGKGDAVASEVLALGQNALVT